MSHIPIHAPAKLANKSGEERIYYSTTVTLNGLNIAVVNGALQMHIPYRWLDDSSIILKDGLHVFEEDEIREQVGDKFELLKAALESLMDQSLTIPSMALKLKGTWAFSLSAVCPTDTGNVEHLTETEINKALTEAGGVATLKEAICALSQKIIKDKYLSSE